MGASKVQKVLQKSIRDGDLSAREGIAIVGALQFLSDNLGYGNSELREKFHAEYGKQAELLLFEVLMETLSPAWPETIPTPLPR